MNLDTFKKSVLQVERNDTIKEVESNLESESQKLNEEEIKELKGKGFLVENKSKCKNISLSVYTN